MWTLNDCVLRSEYAKGSDVNLNRPMNITLVARTSGYKYTLLLSNSQSLTVLKTCVCVCVCTLCPLEAFPDADLYCKPFSIKGTFGEDLGGGFAIICLLDFA